MLSIQSTRVEDRPPPLPFSLEGRKSASRPGTSGQGGEQAVTWRWDERSGRLDSEDGNAVPKAESTPNVLDSN